MAEPWRSRIVGHGEEPPDQLLANPRNWRIHPRGQQQALAGVLTEVGWVQDVIVNRTTGHVVDGHARVSIAISRQEPSVPVVYVELTPEEEQKVLATFDPLGAMAGADREQLEGLLREVRTDDAALRTAIRDLADTNGIDLGTGTPHQAPEAEVDRAEELREKWGTREGQLWEVGRHRLLCGDATKKEDVGRLMGGERAALLFTDPPYGLGLEMRNDGLAGQAQDDFNRSWVGRAWDVLASDAGAVVFNSTRTFPSVLDAGRAAGFEFLRLLTIYKPNDMTYPWRGWLLTSEAILLFQKGQAAFVEVKPYAHDCYSQNHTAATLAADVGGHPAAKQMPVMCDLMSRLGGDAVLDLFVGSGSTVAAAELVGRRCYGVEIEPKYVAVTLERLSKMGLTPRLVEDG